MKRKRMKERDKKTEKEYREIQKERKRNTERERQTKKYTDRNKKRDRDKETETVRKTDTNLYCASETVLDSSSAEEAPSPPLPRLLPKPLTRGNELALGSVR